MLGADHAAVHHPTPADSGRTAYSTAVTMRRTVCTSLGIAGQGFMGQRKAVAGDDQSQHDLSTVAAVMA